MLGLQADGSFPRTSCVAARTAYGAAFRVLTRSLGNAFGTSTGSEAGVPRRFESALMMTKPMGTRMSSIRARGAERW